VRPVYTQEDRVHPVFTRDNLVERVRSYLPSVNQESVTIIGSSIKTRAGRDDLWKRLWSCVDPKNPRWAGYDNILSVRRKLDDLSEQQGSSGLVAQAVELSGDAWEYALRCLVRLGDLKAAWRLIQDCMSALREGDTPDGVQILPPQERSLLAVGQAALQVTDAGELVDQLVAQDVLKALDRCECWESMADLLLEAAVAEAKGVAGVFAGAPTDMAAHASGGSLECLMELASQHGARPWNIDRWNHLLELVSKKGDLFGFTAVLNTMAKLNIKENEVTRSIGKQTVVGRTNLVEVAETIHFTNLVEVAGTVGALTAQRRLSDVKAVFLDSPTMKNGAAVVDKLLLERGNAPPQKDDDSPLAATYTRLFELDPNGDTAVGRGLLVHLNKPSARGSTNHERTLIRTLAELRSAELQASQQTPLLIFHMVDAEQFASTLRLHIPEISADDRKPNYSDIDLPLLAGDLDVQTAALQAAPNVCYALVVVNINELGKKEPLKTKEKFKPLGFQHESHPKIARWREQALLGALQRSLTSTAGARARAKVLLLDTETGKGQCMLWKHWAECSCN